MKALICVMGETWSLTVVMSSVCCVVFFSLCECRSVSMCLVFTLCKDETYKSD